MVKTIGLLATLDTKGVEVAFMRDCIIEHGHRALVVDTGLMGSQPVRPTFPTRRLPRPEDWRWKRYGAMPIGRNLPRS